MKKLSLPLIISLLTYVGAVFFVNPWGEYSINDDWDFFIHVRAFMQGHFTKNSLIDSVFLLQGFLATLWSKIFGLSFNNLRILTVVFTCLAIVGFFKILALYKLSARVQLVALLCFIFNPFVFLSSMSFMTENYFLAFMLWSSYFYLRFIKEPEKIRFLVFSALMGAGSLLIRQFGLVLVVAFVGILPLVPYKATVSIKKRLLAFIVVLLPFVLAYFLGASWPQYAGDHSTRMASLLITTADLPKVANSVIFILPYFAFFLSPFALGYLASLRRFKLILLVLCIALAFYLSPIFFSKDVFAIGNVLHLEGLLVRDEITMDTSLSNTIAFKKVFSGYLALCSLALVSLFFTRLFRNFDPKKRFKAYVVLVQSNLDAVFLEVLFVGFILCVLITQEYFDRYFINASVVAILTLGIFYLPKVTRVNAVATYLALAFLIVMSVFLTTDLYQATKIKWSQARALSERTGIKKGIYVTTSYAKFAYAGSFEDFKDITRASFPNAQYSCFVQTYTTPKSNELINNLMYKKAKPPLINPVMPEHKEKPFIKIEDNLGKLVYNDPYFSPLKNMLGLKSYVGTYCVKGFTKL